MPTIVTRQEWKARKPKAVTSKPGGFKKCAIHHTTGKTLGADKYDDWVRNIQDYHMDKRGWSDIGYNWIVAPDGRIFQGRGNTVVGAHVAGHNSEYLGIAYLGNGDTITDAAKASIKYLVAGRPAKPHREIPGTATDCPGDVMAKWVDAGLPLKATAKPKAGPFYWVDALVGAPQMPALLSLAQKRGVKLVVRSADAKRSLVSLHCDEPDMKALNGWFTEQGIAAAIYRGSNDNRVRRLNKATGTTL